MPQKKLRKIKDEFLDLVWQEFKLVESVSTLNPLARNKVLQALDFARKGHWGQLRYEGIPYIIHPIRTALILIEELNIKEPDVLSAALLHDIVEDTTITIEEIKNQFGPKISRLVKGLTRIRPKNETEKEKERNKLKWVQKIGRSNKKIRLIKLCDILDNHRSMGFIPKNNPCFKKIPRWKRELCRYLPIAKKTNQKLFQLLGQFKK